MSLANKWYLVVDPGKQNDCVHNLGLAPNPENDEAMVPEHQGQVIEPTLAIAIWELSTIERLLVYEQQLMRFFERAARLEPPHTGINELDIALCRIQLEAQERYARGFPIQEAVQRMATDHGLSVPVYSMDECLWDIVAHIPA